MNVKFITIKIIKQIPVRTGATHLRSQIPLNANSKKSAGPTLVIFTEAFPLKLTKFNKRENK